MRCRRVVWALMCVASGLGVAEAGRKALADGRVQTEGLITPRDGESMYVRNTDGQTVVRWTADTRVALGTNYRQLGEVKDRVVRYRISAARDTLSIKLPAGPLYATKEVQRGRVKSTLDEALEEKWLSARGLRVHAAKQADHMPTDAEPFFAGRWKFAKGRGTPATLAIGDTVFEVSMKKGGQTHVLVYGVLATKDCKPFVNRATVIGREQGDELIADEIHLLPIGDQTAADDPTLPRYLVIGDSISGNYDRGLRAALEGKANVHHPPTNCGSSGNGAANIVAWLGAHETKGRHWDVISFNFGHWDAGNSKDVYQKNLEAVIAELKKTGAALIWVTTCPVPDGCGEAGDLKPDGRAPGRKAGVMAKYLNPWAAAVMKRHPEIATCDQWQYVKDNPGGPYTEWWKGANVHFGAEPAAALGRLLAKHAIAALEKRARSQATE